MQWSLFLFILMVQCSFFACHHHEYHFIEDRMSWNAAQNYCRQMYTDLPTVYDMTDINRLSDLMKTGKAWIGLYSNPGKPNRQWHWSLPGVEFNETNWYFHEPDDQGDVENCVFMINNKWKYDSCENKRKFICYNEIGQRFSFIDKTKTWPEAQKHCREHHTDLVSGLSQLREDELEREIETHQWLWISWLWIGLFRDTWRWSDSSNSSFRNWHSNKFEDGGKKECATLHKSGKWSSDDCDDEKPFFCYDVSTLSDQYSTPPAISSSAAASSPTPSTEAVQCTPSDKMILIKESKTWAEALNYCRKYYHDLASITNPHQQSLVQAKAKNADTAFIWVGLLYSCPLDLWFWVNDELLCYENFAPNGKNESCYTSVAMEREREHEWFSKNESETFNFICALQ